ncbi:MAG: TIGR01212 family radical SAM protein [Spirochaetales bacterium]|nr:TIGR01212 family radical SAM protein [Spirochaetales bacterium]
MKPDEPFLNYSRYLRQKYGETAYRVSIDGGFSCPNRGVDRNLPGCSYCSSFGSRSAYIGETEQDVREQIERNLKVLKSRYDARIFMLYFQAYSSTWAPVRQLKKLYDDSLALGRFRELIVSTRPDCLSDATCRLLASYRRDDFDVWVELGLQSAHEQTLKRINRGHDRDQFEEAFSRLRNHGLKIAVHLIFGLPGEDHGMMMETVRYVASLKPEGIKFHNLHIPSDTAMFRELEAGEMAIPSSAGHVRYLADAIERIPPDTVVMRLTTDTPRQRHIVPGAMLDKTIIYNRLREELLRRGTKQGVFF